MPKIPKLPDIPEQERSPFVVQLMEVIHHQVEIIQSLRDEIALLKGNNPKPKIKANKKNEGLKEGEDKKTDAKRPGSTKKKKRNNGKFKRQSS